MSTKNGGSEIGLTAMNMGKKLGRFTTLRLRVSNGT